MRALIAIFALALSANGVSAFTVSEPLDFANATSTASNVGTLSNGLNTISGSLTGSGCLGPGPGGSGLSCNIGPDSQDSFLFDVASNSTVDSIILSIFDITAPDGFIPFLSGADKTASSTFVRFGGGFGNTPVISGNLLDTATGPGGVPFVGPFGPGTYLVSIFGQQSPVNEAWSLGWTLSINATGPQSVVPLPAALPLFGTGLAAMGFFGWRRKRRSAVTA